MTYETILVENVDGVATITLNRPERLNAWTYQMGAELSSAVQAGNEDDDVLAFVVTGAGRGFCAGADIGDVFQAQAEGEDVGRNDGPRDWVGEIRAAKPMVAAINGAAIGVGLTQVLPMDYLIAADDAKLSVCFVQPAVELLQFANDAGPILELGLKALFFGQFGLPVEVEGQAVDDVLVACAPVPRVVLCSQP